MSSPLDIHNILQTGYFATSRARNGNPCVPRCNINTNANIPSCHTDSSGRASPQPQPPPSPRFAPAPSPRHSRSPEIEAPSSHPSRPPPPVVEDEEIALAKEHGAPAVPELAGEQAQSRGEVDQDQLIMDVHEHNPERRFVILMNSATEAKKAAQDKPTATDTKQASKQTPERTDSRKTDTTAGRKPETTTDRHPYVTQVTPELERRKSRQRLPRLETEATPDQLQTEHHRSRSFAGDSRPDYFSPRKSRPYGDHLLSPDVIKHGSNGRDRPYHGHGPAPRSPTQRNGFPTPDRGHDDRRNGKSPTPSSTKRSSSTADPRLPRRPLSTERMRESRQHEDYHARGATRDSSRSYGRSNGEKTKPPTTNRSREHSRSPQTSNFPNRTSTATSSSAQDDRTPGPGSDKGSDGGRNARPLSQVRTSPLPSPSRFGHPDMPTRPRSSATFPLMESTANMQERVSSRPHYPEEIDHKLGARDGLGKVDNTRLRPNMTIPMPDIPSNMSIGPGRPDEVAGKATSPAGTPTRSSQPWQPAKFDPERDGTRLSSPMGSYRRYSESKDTTGPAKLPECRRTVPVAGMINWLTLPRTDFNICPECYGAVFSNSEYRTHFRPMLRPTDEAISCDFGSSPWYRIAWLLTLKNERPDLRLFHYLASVRAASQNQPCPGDRRVTRSWLTVRDPYSRKPVSDFTVCHRCAKTVVALLPNLSGVFMPLDSRQEPIRGICAFHFAPERKQFVEFFDAMETISDKALAANQGPDVAELAERLERSKAASTSRECCEDNPVSGGQWHTMQYLPRFTVCGECFHQVVSPKLNDESVIARNFYMKPQKIPWATCQLYSSRMRDIFEKACRANDPVYLEERVKERQRVEADIRAELIRLDREGRNDARTERQVEELVREWKRWE